MLTFGNPIATPQPEIYKHHKPGDCFYAACAEILNSQGVRADETPLSTSLLRELTARSFEEIILEEGGLF